MTILKRVFGNLLFWYFFLFVIYSWKILIFRSYKILIFGDSKFWKNTGFRVIKYFFKWDVYNIFYFLNLLG